MISTLRPPASLAKSSAASCAPTSEPLPTWSANGPEKSLNTPILILSPGICACPAAGKPASAAAASAAPKSDRLNLEGTGDPPRFRPVPNRRDLSDSNDPGVPDGAGFACILRWSAPPDKPEAAADRSGAAIEVAIVAGFYGFYHDS